MSAHDPLHSFINHLANKFVYDFDVYRNEMLGDIPLAFMARHFRRDEKYMISKRVKIWGVENQQYIFVTARREPVTKQFLHQFQKEIRGRIEDYVLKHKEHMSTIFIGMVVTDQPLDEQLAKGVMRYRKIKWIKYGLYGWAEVYVAVVDLTQEKIYIHPKGKTFIEPLEKMFLKGSKV